MNSVTPKQKQVLDYLTDHIAEHGYSPTLDQIRKRFRLRSISTVHKHLTTLRDKGLITREHNTPRGIALRDRTTASASRLIPITGTIAADGTVSKNTSEPSTVDVPADLADSESAFALRIAESPPPGSALQEGDVLIAKKTSERDGHDLFIAEINDRTRLIAATAARDDDGGTRSGERTEGTVRAVVTGMVRNYGRNASGAPRT